jgi:hypothetical protein
MKVATSEDAQMLICMYTEQLADADQTGADDTSINLHAGCTAILNQRPATNNTAQVEIDVNRPPAARYGKDDMVIAQKLRDARRYGILDAKQKWCDSLALSPPRDGLLLHDAAAAAAAAGDAAGEPASEPAGEPASATPAAL